MNEGEGNHDVRCSGASHPDPAPEEGEFKPEPFHSEKISSYYVMVTPAVSSLMFLDGVCQRTAEVAKAAPSWAKSARVSTNEGAHIPSPRIARIECKLQSSFPTCEDWSEMEVAGGVQRTNRCQTRRMRNACTIAPEIPVRVSCKYYWLQQKRLIKAGSCAPRPARASGS